MDRYSIVHSEDFEKIRKEFKALDQRTRESFSPDGKWNYGCTLHIILTPIATFIAFVSSGDPATTLAVFFAYLIYPGPIVTAIIANILFGLFENRMQRFWENRRQQSKWYARHTFLKAEIDRIDTEEREAERRRFSSSFDLLARLRELRDGTNLELGTIEGYFRRKKKWYDEYREYEARLSEIALLSETIAAKIDHHVLEFPDLPLQLATTFKALHAVASREHHWSHRLLDKLEGMKGWVSSADERSSNRISIASGEGSGRGRPSGGTVHARLEGKVSNERIQDRAIHVVEQTPPCPPEPLKRIERVAVANISIERYLQMAEAKMSIGDIGERLVLDFERQRVERETGKPATMVRRVSTESDSYGYDIISLFDGEEVHIEVKTTRGKFDNDFFLTSNERKVMQELGESYWLYRVYELSAEEGTAKLSAFRGQSTIEDSFILEPSAFVFRRRRHDTN